MVMSNIPAHVLLGTPKEATAYIYQIRAMRKASPTLVNTLNTAFAKQAYSWEDFKTGLTSSSPTSYGLAGAGTGALLAALNEERKKKKHRDYSNVLWGALTGGGLGAGGAYLADKAEIGNIGERLKPGGEGGAGAGKTLTDEQVKTIKDQNQQVADAEANEPRGLIDSTLGMVEGTANMALRPGYEAINQTIGPDSVVGLNLVGEPNHLVSGLAGSAIGHGGLSGLEAWGNRIDRNRVVKPQVANEVKQLRDALPEAVRAEVTSRPVPLTEQIAEIPGRPATPGSPAVPATPPTYKDGNIIGADGKPIRVIDKPGTPGRPAVPATPEVPGTPAQSFPTDTAALRLREVQNWMDTASQGDVAHLLNGGTVQIEGRPYRYDDLVETLGDTTIKPVAGGHQFAPNTLENLSSARPQSAFVPEWLQDLRRKLPGNKRTPVSVVQDVRGRTGPLTADQKTSIPGKIGRNKVLRRLAHVPGILGLLMQGKEMVDTRGEH